MEFLRLIVLNQITEAKICLVEVFSRIACDSRQLSLPRWMFQQLDHALVSLDAYAAQGLSFSRIICTIRLGDGGDTPASQNVEESMAG